MYNSIFQRYPSKLTETQIARITFPVIFLSFFRLAVSKFVNYFSFFSLRFCICFATLLTTLFSFSFLHLQFVFKMLCSLQRKFNNKYIICVRQNDTILFIETIIFQFIKRIPLTQFCKKQYKSFHKIKVLQVQQKRLSKQEKNAFFPYSIVKLLTDYLR